MKHVLIAVAVQLALGTATAYALPIRAPKAVNDAIAIDVCSGDPGLLARKVAAERLTKRNRKMYDEVVTELDAQYKKSAGTDSAVEAVRVAFCINR